MGEVRKLLQQQGQGHVELRRLVSERAAERAAVRRPMGIECAAGAGTAVDAAASWNFGSRAMGRIRIYRASAHNCQLVRLERQCPGPGAAAASARWCTLGDAHNAHVLVARQEDRQAR